MIAKSCEHRVLIANRGEIACRIARACAVIGVTSVAVYSEADETALHVAATDVALPIGPAPARASYLDINRLIQAAKASGATAVHPGYGFLSESPAFVEAVEAAGMIWIGPSAQSIIDMGDKQRARSIAAAHGLPILPGSLRFAIGDDGLENAAAAIGFPLLLKAACGGGGIGMRRVEAADELLSVAATTQSLAERLFGDGAIYLERLITRPRHIEVQIFGDGAGGAIHLFERECSIQRRFQKIVEESPAPALSEKTRRALAEGAVALAKAQNYRGPGTVEFLLDADSDEFFFLEMNTRIQVEHPVTEMVTGRDLVVMQLELALCGEVDLAAPVQIHGHAIECRLYAEDPAAGFRPSPGRLTRLDLPAGEGVRLDFGYRAGDLVTPHYDPLIGKIIVYGDDRADALQRMRAALGDMVIEGPATNLAFLDRVIGHAAFQSGQVDTSFVDRHRDSLVQSPKHQRTIA